jgi:hypothetical protein
MFPSPVTRGTNPVAMFASANKHSLHRHWVCILSSEAKELHQQHMRDKYATFLPTDSSTYKPIRSRLWRKTTWCLVEELYTFERSKSIIWGTPIFFWKLAKPPDWKLIKVWVISNLYITVLSLNYPRQVKLHKLRIQCCSNSRSTNLSPLYLLRDEKAVRLRELLMDVQCKL